MITSIVAILSACAQCATAFHAVNPSFIENNSFHYVDQQESVVQKYLSQRKQQTLLINNTTLTSSNYTPSLTTSAQIETMTAGMTYLYSNNNDQAFSANITLNAKDYQVLIDTGSPYLWLYGSECRDNSCKEKKLFDPKAATQVNDDTFALSYDSGVASGFIYEDGIIIAGFETKSFKFGVADHVPDLFKDYQFSGVLGLPADNTSNTGLLNAASYLSENNDIKSSKFTICIGEYDSDSTNSGLLYLGSTMDSLYEGTVHTALVIDEAVSHWEIKIDNVYIDDFLITFDTIRINDQPSNHSRIGLLDSGTSSLVLPVQDANRIHSFLSRSITDGQNYAILCNTSAIFDIEIAGKNWTLSPDLYVGEAYPVESDLHGYCVSNIQGIDSVADKAWILGILFMKNRYVEFDYENRWISIAERNNNIRLVNPPHKQVNSSTTTYSTTLSTMISVTTPSVSTSSTSSTSSSISSHSNSVPKVTTSSFSVIYIALSLLSLF
ncbi:hypothetical protein CANINC_003429 [Pichia inconspicua]|uniref:Peptidase A1 domain-containing protein n=1 Tax=Pichia inconspicua TaxID=52247 RepID=A0A4T0WYJ9_9ASCO|nr:hypothetical protein CANINC_003429 [[Candida] inconspicua]